MLWTPYRVMSSFEKKDVQGVPLWIEFLGFNFIENLNFLKFRCAGRPVEWCLALRKRTSKGYPFESNF